MNLNLPQNTSDNSQLREAIKLYSKNWKWFLVSAVICIVLATVYLRYAVPKYSAEAKIQIIDEKSGSGIDLFKELNLLTGGKGQVTDELEILNSYSNFLKVVEDLRLNIQVMAIGKIKDSELYGNSPVNMNFISPDSIINKTKFEFFLNISSANTFGMSLEEGGSYKNYAFGSNIETPIGDMVITPDLNHLERWTNNKLKISIIPLSDAAKFYKANLVLSIIDDQSNIIGLSISDPVRQKAKDILDKLIATYNENAIIDKRIIADRTSEFINDRISEIALNLSSVDQSAQDLKTSRGLTDIASEANINLNVGAANRQELANTETQLSIAASMQDILDQQSGYDVLPANIGLNDPTVASTTEKYNQLVLERNRLLKSSTERSPIIQNLDQQLNGLRQSMSSSLNSTINSLNLQVNTLRGQQAIINSKIYSAPGNERALRDITRRQQTTESLYLYLLQKREEAQLLVASSSPRSKIIDQAYYPSKFPVSPKSRLIYVASFLLGLLVPFSIIYVNDILDTKVHNMNTLEKISKNVPVLGELPKLSKKELRTVVKDDRSVLSEALRIIRTNLDYLLRMQKGSKKRNVVFVTSSTPGEGKTFLSTNLAMILSSTNKKVLLIGADIRNPKFYTFLTGSQIDRLDRGKKRRDSGLTDYIYDPTKSSADIIQSMLVHNNSIDVIYSGRIPPNPAELLLSNRVESLINEMSEKYDYVIVDTAPLMVVTDTLLISQYADLMVYVTRAGITDKNDVSFPIKLKQEGKIPNLAFIVNDVKSSNLGYGGKYGYGYSGTRKKWWKA